MRHKQKMLPYKKMAIEWHQEMKTSMHQSYISFSVGRTEIFFQRAVLENVTKLYYFSFILKDSASDAKPLKKQELWKTASLDRNPQLNQAQVVKRYEGHSTSALNAPFWTFLSVP